MSEQEFLEIRCYVVNFALQGKGKVCCVKIKAFCRSAAVKCIAENWQAAAGKVDADLVGTAGVKAALYEKALAAFYSKLLENTEISF
jgi:hypothetical protein